MNDTTKVGGNGSSTGQGNESTDLFFSGGTSLGVSLVGINGLSTRCILMSNKQPGTGSGTSIGFGNFDHDDFGHVIGVVMMKLGSLNCVDGPIPIQGPFWIGVVGCFLFQ